MTRGCGVVMVYESTVYDKLRRSTNGFSLCTDHLVRVDYTDAAA
ncbi:hypothetical protein CCACVL1_17458, partial [Corchorus capsularis]